MTTQTDKVLKGASFEEFALDCARAFMPLFSLRDTPEAPIPERIEPEDGYHVNALRETRERKAEVLRMSDAEAQAAADAEVDDYERRMEELREERAANVVWLRDMRARVEVWQPPTPNHAGLKEHMGKVLDREIEWQSRPISVDAMERLDGAEWKRRTLLRLDSEVARHEQEIADAREMAAFNTTWLQRLRESVRDG